MNPTAMCTLTERVQIVPATRCDYEQLARFHYLGASPGPIRKIFKLIDPEMRDKLAAPVIGVIVYGAPPANLAARNAAVGGTFGGLDRSAGLTLLNERMVCIRRVIIEPRYRGLGLAAQLVRETLTRAESPMVEAVSVMGRMHPFFERAGMRRWPCPADERTERMTAALEAVGIDPHCPDDAEAVWTQIRRLDAAQQAFIREQTLRFCRKFNNRRSLPYGAQCFEFVLSKLTTCKQYYLWCRSAEKMPIR